MIRRRTTAERNAARLVCVLVAATLAPGCVMGPDFARPKLAATAGYAPGGAVPAPIGAGSDAQHFLSDRDVPARWWSLFHSAAIDTLVDQALAANQDLKSAQAALRAVHETLAVQRGTLYPELDGAFYASRQRNSNTLASPLSSNSQDYSLYTGQLSIGYTPDVFGGVQRQIEAVTAQDENQRYTVEAAYLSLTANVVVAAIQLASLGAQIAATQTIIAADKDLLDKFEQKKRLGETASGDAALQETVLAQAEATLPPLRKLRGQQQHLLAQLTGRTPAELADLSVALGDLTLPAELPLTLPSKLVDQRPDIRAAEANLHFASAQLGVAIANRFPALTLSAALGGASTDLASLFAGSNTFWTLTGGITHPIFDAGALRHKQRVAEAQLDQAKAQYASALLVAFQNVADALLALQEDTAAVAAQDHARQAARKSLDVATLNLQQGEGNSVALLNAQQAYAQSLVALNQAQGARYADTAALFQALGGGWWNRGPTDQISGPPSGTATASN